MKKIRVFDSPDDLARERSSLLAVSNKFGLTFVGQGRALRVFVTDDIITAGRVSGSTNEIGNVFAAGEIKLFVPRPRRVAVKNQSQSIGGQKTEAEPLKL